MTTSHEGAFIAQLFHELRLYASEGLYEVAEGDDLTVVVVEDEGADVAAAASEGLYEVDEGDDLTVVVVEDEGADVAAAAAIAALEAAEAPPDDCCAVCLHDDDDGEEEATPSSSTGAWKRIAACGHRFHGACVERWLMVKLSCPVCRRPAAVATVE